MIKLTKNEKRVNYLIKRGDKEKGYRITRMPIGPYYITFPLNLDHVDQMTLACENLGHTK